MENSPDLWRSSLPWPPDLNAHKYERGHVFMAGGAIMTGAIRLAARASLRMGAGLCTVAAPAETMAIYQSEAPHVLFKSINSLMKFSEFINGSYRKSCVIGPGMGQNDPEMLCQSILAVLALKIPTVIDADGISVFKEVPERLSHAIHCDAILTPHEGEFARIFPDITGNRLERAVTAARLCDCTILLKGPETIIAQADGKIVVNRHSTPWLATAGTGDVLSGMIAGLMAQGMAPFDSACAAAWMHGEAGLLCGPGLVAPDLIEALPRVMRNFA